MSDTAGVESLLPEPKEGDAVANAADSETGTEEVKPKEGEFVFPEKFMKDGEQNVEALANSYKELEQKLSERNAPEKYELTLSEDLPQDIITLDDPLLVKVQNAAKENNVSQKQLDAITNVYLKDMSEQMEASKTEEMSNLGTDAKEIVGRVETYYSGVLNKEDYELLRSVSVSADVLRVFDKVRAYHTSETKIPPNLGEGVPKSLTEMELRGKMKTEAYNNPRHPEYEKVHLEVREGYTKLYPKK